MPNAANGGIDAALPLPKVTPAQALARAALGLLRPRAAADALPRGPGFVPGLWVALVGLVWSGLSLWLHLDGHAPTRAGFGLPREGYYLVQAAVLPPALLVGWRLLSWAAARGLPAPPSAKACAAALAGPYGSAILWLFVLPDTLAYALGGFEALAPMLRVTGPALGLGAWVSCTRALQQTHGLAFGPAMARAGLGLLAQAALLGAVIR